jgi:hypothetical protein
VRSEVVVSVKLLGASLVGAKRVVARCDFSLTDTLDSSQVCQRMSVGHPAARTMSVRRQTVTSCLLSPVSNRCSPWGRPATSVPQSPDASILPLATSALVVQHSAFHCLFTGRHRCTHGELTRYCHHGGRMGD